MSELFPLRKGVISITWSWANRKFSTAKGGVASHGRVQFSQLVPEKASHEKNRPVFLCSQIHVEAKFLIFCLFFHPAEKQPPCCPAGWFSSWRQGKFSHDFLCHLRFPGRLKLCVSFSAMSDKFDPWPRWKTVRIEERRHIFGWTE